MLLSSPPKKSSNAGNRKCQDLINFVAIVHLKKNQKLTNFFSNLNFSD